MQHNWLVIVSFAQGRAQVATPAHDAMLATAPWTATKQQPTCPAPSCSTVIASWKACIPCRRIRLNGRS